MPTPADRLHSAARFVDDVGFLSSTLRSGDTGVEGTVIWFFAGEFTRYEAQHGPRIQVSLGATLTLESLADSVGVTITSPPRVLGTLPGEVVAQLLGFIEKNRRPLLRYWQGEMATSDVLELLVRV